jgi:Osmosensitive K+ channel histidine kinase
MKTKVIWFILFLAIISLFIFQSMWLYHTFHLKINDVQKEINTLFTKSIDKEVMLRIEQNIPEVKIGQTTTIPKDATITDYVEFNENEIVEAGIHQQILNYDGFPFKLISLDSIFKLELNNADLTLKYYLCYKDSTGTIIDQMGNLPQSKIDKAFHTESLLIVDGKRVQAIVNITPSTVFQQMLALLIASFVMLVIIMFCVFYQTKSIFDEIKLSRLRQDFSRALTHDMKTPLNTIKTILDNFISGLLNNKPEMREKHGKIAMDQVENLLSLIDKVLTISLIEEGKYSLNRKVTDIHIIIKELEERFSVWKNKPILIQTSVDIEENKIIFIDGELIKNAISNLIENAIKYSKDSVAIEISCYILNDNLHIVVKDNGIGISDKNKEKIFEKFEREAIVRKKGIIGFGVGLNYVKLVTNLHEGLIELYTTEGEYSEFSLIIPLNKQGYVAKEDNIE